MKHVSIFRRGLLLALLTAGGYAARAQSVGIGTTAPDASAALDIMSTTKGLLLPRVASAAALATPATGLLVFQTGAPAGFYYNAGTPAAPSWQQIATAAGAAITAGNGLTKTGQNVALGGSLTTPATILQNGNNFSLTGGNVGIGTALPQATLETSGDFRVSNGTVSNTLGTPATGNASNTSFPNAGQSFTLPAGGGSITSVRLRSAATYSTTFSLYQGGGNGGALLYGPAPISFVTDVPSTVALPTPLALAAGIYTVTLTAPQNLRYFTTDAYLAGTFYFGPSASGGTIDMEFAVSYTTGAATSSLYVAPGGNVGIGTSGTTAASQKLEVAGGSILISTAGQGLVFPDGSTQTTAATAATTASNGLTKTGNNIALGGPLTAATDLPLAGQNLTFSGTGNVGIGGSAAPTQTLDVTGTTRTTNAIVTTALTGTGASIGAAVGLGIRADGGLNIGQNTTGNSIYLGTRAGAGASGSTGRNTFLGYEAGNFAGTASNNNLFMGFRAGYNGSGGGFNLFVGGFSGYLTNGGSSNVFVGYNGGYHNTSGSKNTALGDNSGPASGSGAITNATALGADVTLTQSNTVVLGSGANVGIGTSSPTSALTVAGAVALPFLTASADLTLTNAHYTVRRADGCATITFPAPGTCPGRVYVIINSSTTTPVSLPTGAYDDTTSSAIFSLTARTRIMIQSDGTSWIVIAN